MSDLTNGNYHVILTIPPEDYNLTFHGADNKPYLIIHPNKQPKTIWIDPELNVEEAAKMFWHAVARLGGFVITHE